jgi:hypothetical protein
MRIENKSRKKNVIKLERMILYKITIINKNIKHKNRAIKSRGIKSDKKSN